MSTHGPTYPHRPSEVSTVSTDDNFPPPKSAFPTEGSMEAYIVSSRDIIGFAKNMEQQGREQEARELFTDALKKLQTVCDRGTIPAEIEVARALVREQRKRKKNKNKQEKRKKECRNE
jgi:hypothetical protein